MELPVEAYILKEKNKYTVHFLNKAKLSMQQIQVIFSKYGTVSINNSGDITGMHFVAYKSLTEIIKCVSDLQGQTLIKLLPERSYRDKNVIQKNNDFINKKKTTAKQNMFQKCKIEDNMIKNNKNLHEIFDDKFTKNKQTNAEKAYCYEDNDAKDSNTSSEIQSTISNLTKKSVGSDTASKSGYDNLSEISCTNSSIDLESSQHIKDINDDKTPRLISSHMYKYGTSIESLDQICSNSHSITKPNIVRAEHIVVANVHRNFGVHYILHLFEKYNPIAASTMQIIDQTGIRYCHVYFKNTQDALEVEQNYDEFPIYGKRLIVLRPMYNLKEL